MDHAQILEGMHALGAASEFSGRLRATEQKFAEDGGFRAGEVESVGKPMLVFGDAAVAASGADENLLAERTQRAADGIFIEGHDRIAIRFLIAGVEEGVQRERVVFWRGDFFFDEGGQYAGFDIVQGDIHERNDTEMRCASQMWVVWAGTVRFRGAF